MANDKSISIRFDEDDMEDLREFMRWRMNKNFVSIDSDFDLREAASLIKKAAQEKQEILRQIERERGSQQELKQQREDVALIPGWEGERMQRQWAKEAAQQAESYAAATNSGKRSRSTTGADASITEGVLSWIKRQRARGHYPKTVS